MWKKIKNYLIIVGAAILVFVLTIFYVLMRGSKADRQGSTGADERDSAIQDGIRECQESVDRCGEHLQRAEDILRRAIERSREGKPET